MDLKEKIRFQIEKGKEIPPLPQVAIQALEMVMKNDVNIDDLARVIESDPALSVKILNLVNKASISTLEIKSISHAITMVGLNIVRYALLGVIVEGISKKENQDTVEAQKSLWSHSLCCAISSSLISEKTYPELKNKAFICGLLHDIGKAALLALYPDQYLALLEDLTPYSNPLLMEEKTFNINHCFAAKWLATKWELPEEVKEVVLYHHHPPHTLYDLSKNVELLQIVKLGNILSHMFFLEMWFEENEYHRLLKILDFKENDVSETLARLKKEYNDKAKFFDLHSNITDLYADVIDKTRIRLASISIELELRNRKLQKLNKLQSILLNFATNLINIHSYNSIFSSLNSVFQSFKHYKIGALYVLNLKDKLLNACFFQKEKDYIKIATFLDDTGNPIWDNNFQKFPKYVKKFLSVVTAQVHKKLSKEILKETVVLNPPFVFLPFHLSKFGITGEICLVFEDEVSEIDEDEKNLWLQIIGMVQQSLEKIEAIKQLETKTEELTMALYKNQKFQERLLQTERLASIGQLAAGVAHEINNPLAIISGRVQMLMFSEKDEKKIDQLQQILQQIDRISSLLNRIMDFARVRKPEFGPVDIRNLLDKLIEFIKTGFEKRGIVVLKEYSDVPTIKGDFSQLEQVFLNLLINAKQALEKKLKDAKVTVKIELDNSKDFVVVKIIDNGCGIPRHLLNRVFEPFFTTKEPGKGTGLGLSTSLSIVEQHCGKIIIKSEENVGTEVEVYLPVDVDKFKKKEPKRDFQITPDTTVLVVDDEKYIREILKEVLKKEGFSVVDCANGMEAMDILENKKIDLLLLDIKMPVMDGITLIKSLKKKSYKIPIVIITGWAEDEQVKEILKEHEYYCIKKPFHIKDVLKAVYKSLTKEKK